MSRLREAMAAVRDNPKSSKAWSDLGDQLAANGQIHKAKESYQRALQLDPLNAAAQAGLANMLMAQDAAAKATTSEAERAAPDLPSQSAVVEEEFAPEQETHDDGHAPVRAKAARSRAKEAPARTLREAPPWPEKPSRGRMMVGVLFLLLVPLLCLCTLLFALARAI